MIHLLYDAVLLRSATGSIVTAVRDQFPFLPALVVVGVGVAAVVAVAFSERKGVRPAFLAVFFAGIVVINLVGVPVLPFMHWQKFSDVQSTETTFYDYRVVTADGAEIPFEERSLTNVDGAYMQLVSDEMRSADESRRAELSAYMLDRARVHRTKVESRSPLHYLRFPPHSIGEWTAADLEGHAEFVGLRTYDRTVVVSEDGTRLVSDTEALVFEYMEPASSASVTTPAVTMPAVSSPSSVVRSSSPVGASG